MTLGTLSGELDRFASREHRFGSQTEINDMWLEVDLGNLTFEKALVEYVRVLLAGHYKPFRRIKVDEHC